jgi:GNAT superfamily N-acetyltransferase
MDELTVRAATAEDLPALLETVRQGFETYRTWAPRSWAPPERELHLASLRGRMAEPGCLCAIAEAPGGEPAGQVGAGPQAGAPHVRHLWMLFVREAWWGTGVASRLLAAAVADAQQRGARELRLQTPAEHARARAFYEREGWRRHGDPQYDPMLGLVLVGYRRAAGPPPGG